MSDEPIEHRLQTMIMEKMDQRQVLRCILHTILFNRAALDATTRDGNQVVVPCEMECDVFDPPISYVRINFGSRDTKAAARSVPNGGGQEIVALVDRKIEAFCKQLNERAGEGELRLVVFAKVLKKRFPFGEKEERVDLERWIIPVQVNSDAKADQRESTRAKIRADLLEIMLSIVRHVNDVTKLEGSVYFRIETDGKDPNANGWDLITDIGAFMGLAAPR